MAEVRACELVERVVRYKNDGFKMFVELKKLVEMYQLDKTDIYELITDISGSIRHSDTYRISDTACSLICETLESFVAEGDRYN